jgi:hypothetical protein
LGAIEILLSSFAAPGGDPNEVARSGRLYESPLLATANNAS